MKGLTLSLGDYGPHDLAPKEGLDGRLVSQLRFSFRDTFRLKDCSYLDIAQIGQTPLLMDKM